ncbi:DUF998 domain-containing protein [Streptomyces hiroshimensis]|uniref:DUF998 domain-containing protein n=1 Tax=Streptomyces hiroshimensis TaxID=66424 RepID=A0ABQ2YKK0_9ACTN|nr:DUF998 domain-containing protein [Streptomyces hiroshimensis]GGX86801.1 hypothetical protein GCM10010324_35380 [Streptomyces hiroshimensis]
MRDAPPASRLHEAGPGPAPAAAGARAVPREARPAWLLAAAAVAYNAWLLEFLLPTGLDARHSYVSELYAADQRFHVLFGTIEIATAVLVAVGAAPLPRPPGSSRWALAGRWALVAFASSSVADVVVPMHCAPSVNRACEVVNPWHTATSALAHAALFASMALMVTAAAGGTRWPLIRRWGPWVLAVALTTALATVGPLIGRPGWHGIPQRAHLVLVGVWLALLAASLGDRGECRHDSGA